MSQVSGSCAMSSSAEWGAQPMLVAPMWRPPPPPARDEHGQFSDAADSDDEDVAWGAGSSLQTVVAAPTAAVPRLALEDMVATAQPVDSWAAPAAPVPRRTLGDTLSAAEPADSWDAPSLSGPLSGQLSQLSLEDCSGGSSGAPSPDDSRRSVAGTASVSLRSYLDPATGDVTDSETLNQLAELEELTDTARTVRPDSGHTATASPATARGRPQQPHDRHPQPYSYAADCDESRVGPALSDRGVVESGLGADGGRPVQEDAVRRSLSDRGGVVSGRVADCGRPVEEDCGRPVEEDGVRRSVVTAGGGLAVLRESYRGGTVTSLVMLAAEQTVSTSSARGRQGSGGGVREGSGDAPIPVEHAAREHAAGTHGRPRTFLADGLSGDAGMLPATDGGHPNSAPLLSNGRRTEAAATAVAADSGRGLPAAAAPDGGWPGADSADPVLWPAAAEQEPACPVHGETGRGRAFKRSPARRLSFTLDSPSPLLVQYYMKHPEERLQVLENAASMAPEPVSPPAAEPAGDTRGSAAEAGLAAPADRPRRRWADDGPAAVQLRTTLAGRRAGPALADFPPADRSRRSAVPLGWGSALHRLSAPPAASLLAPPPAASLRLSPADAGSPSARHRRTSPPPAACLLSPPRRPTPNFDSHAIQEVVQGLSAVSADVSWGPASASPSPPRPPLPPRVPAQRSPAGSEPPTSDTDHMFDLPVLDELRRLLSRHEAQLTALVEQQRRQRRALELACRRREQALLLRLRRQLAAAELLTAEPTSPPPTSDCGLTPPPPGAGDYRDGQLTFRRSPLSPPAAQQAGSEAPSAYERYEAHPGTSPTRPRPARPAADAVPTPVARRLASPPAAHHPVTVPPQALEPGMQARYAKVTAAARGYLTRRLMRTEKVQSLIAAAKESMMCALRLQREVDVTKQVTKQDVELHERLVNQVRGACYSLHQLFIAWSPQQRLAVIAADRAARAHAAERRRCGEPAASSLSHATLLALQRRRLLRDTGGAGSRPGTASPRVRPRRPAGSPRGRPASVAVCVSPKPRLSPAGRPRRVTAHSPRAASRSSLQQDRAAATGGGRVSRTTRSLIQLATIYAPNPVRRAKSSQSQLAAGYCSQPQAGEPKRRHRSGQAWR